MREEDRAHHGVNDEAAACAAEVVTKPCLLHIFPHKKKVKVPKGSYKGAFPACTCFSLFLDPSHALTAAVQRWIFFCMEACPGRAVDRFQPMPQAGALAHCLW